MKLLAIGFGSVLSNESSFEIDFLKTYLKHHNIPFREKKNRDDTTVIYISENYIGRLPKNSMGAYLPTSEDGGPPIYEIYNTDLQ